MPARAALQSWQPAVTSCNAVGPPQQISCLRCARELYPFRDIGDRHATAAPWLGDVIVCAGCGQLHQVQARWPWRLRMVCVDTLAAMKDLRGRVIALNFQRLVSAVPHWRDWPPKPAETEHRVFY